MDITAKSNSPAGIDDIAMSLDHTAKMDAADRTGIAANDEVDQAAIASRWMVDQLPATTLPSSSFISGLLAAVRLTNGLFMLLPAFMLVKILGVPPREHFWNIFFSMVLFNGLVGVLIFESFGLYSEALFESKLQSRKILAAWLTTFTFILASNIVFNLAPHVPKAGWLFWFVTTYVLLIAERLALLGLFRFLTKRNFYLENTVILGYNQNGIRLAEAIKEKGDIRTGLIGFIDDRPKDRLPEIKSGFALLGNTEYLESLVRQEKVQQILVALPWWAVMRMNKLAEVLKRLPVKVQLAPDMQAFRYAHNRVSQVAGLPMFNISDLPLTGWSPAIKRLEDIVLSLIAIAVFAPVMLLVALLIKLDSPGPVLFRQKRYGYNNKLIEVFKFRSMYQSMADANADQQTVKADPRVTRIGRFIRRTSIDELPQLFNVLLGSMSMVGPRPHASATKAAGILFEDAVQEYTSRHRVKPGITGWAQVNGYRGETDTVEKIEKRVEFDLEYIENWSVWMDLYILARTVPALIFTKEAY